MIFFASFVRVFLVKMRIVALSIPILAAEISEEQSMEVEALQSIYATEFESMCCGYFERLFCVPRALLFARAKDVLLGLNE